MSENILMESHNLLLARTLSDLIHDESALSPASLARKLNIPTNKITRILNGDVTDPKASTLIQIASYFGITIEQLLGLEPITKESVSASQATRSLPIYEFHNPNKMATEWYRWIPNDIDGTYYALSIDTDLYEPVFQKNALLIVNADIEPEDRSYVFIKQTDNPQYGSIKNYVIENDKHYLYPINPKLPIEVLDKNLHTVAGVILEVHQKLRLKK